MKRNPNPDNPITKPLLEGLVDSSKIKEQAPVPKPTVENTPPKAPDLSHDSGGGYNSDKSFPQS